MPEHPAVLIARTVGVPVAGTNEVQTLTIGGTPTGGSFKLRHNGMPTSAIPWSAVNATLLASINSACNAAFGTSSIVATAGTLTAGIGTILLTFGGKLALLAVTTLTTENALTGTTPTVVVVETTPGVNVTYRNARPGMILQSDNGNNYRNSSTTASAPVWTAM